MSEPLVEEVSFRFTIADISRPNGGLSPVFSYNGVNWHLYISKRVEESGQKWLKFGLHLYSNIPTNRSFTVTMKIKLLSHLNNGTDQEISLGPYLFNSSLKTYAKNDCIPWADVIDPGKGYVNEYNMISVRVNLNVEENKSTIMCESIDKSCPNGCSSKLRLKVLQIEMLSSTSIEPNDLTIHGAKIQVQLKKQTNDLAILLLFPLMKTEDLFSCSFEVHLLSSKVSLKKRTTEDHTIHKKKRGITLLDIISFDDLMNPQNEFIENETINIELNITTKKLQNKSIINCEFCVNQRKFK